MNARTKTGASPPPKAVTAPPEFDDLIGWTAWLYYVDELTQNAIAETLSVSRATLVKLLQNDHANDPTTLANYKANKAAIEGGNGAKAVADLMFHAYNPPQRALSQEIRMTPTRQKY